jgi:hypothetical protein
LSYGIGFSCFQAPKPRQICAILMARADFL